MSSTRILGISLSFIGLLVGAGFATGREVVQYFSSFGMWGVAGAVVAGIVMALAGTVFLQLGSFFHAREHKIVFRNVSHPIISRILDISVVITLFSVGFVMLAGAGSNLEQQFGWSPWIGSLGMLILVLIAGMLDVDKVSKIIGWLTPLIIIAVIIVAVYTVLNWPEDIGAAAEYSAQQDSPIGNWLLSALNYNGLALILAVSMALVIGGDHLDPREAGWGGLIGGIGYAVMLLLAVFAMVFNAETVEGTSIPMLTLVNEIHPTLGLAMAAVIYFMVFNTAIGMFYALGKRMSAGHEDKYRPIFIVGALAGFAVSFVGFDTLMEYVYPVLGYLGMFMIAVLVFAWFRSFGTIREEASKREKLRDLVAQDLHPDKTVDSEDKEDLNELLGESNLEKEELHSYVSDEVAMELGKDDDVDFEIGDDYEMKSSEHQGGSDDNSTSDAKK